MWPVDSTALTGSSYRTWNTPPKWMMAVFLAECLIAEFIGIELPLAHRKRTQPEQHSRWTIDLFGTWESENRTKSKSSLRQKYVYLYLASTPIILCKHARGCAVSQNTTWFNAVDWVRCSMRPIRVYCLFRFRGTERCEGDRRTGVLSRSLARQLEWANDKYLCLAYRWRRWLILVNGKNQLSTRVYDTCDSLEINSSDLFEDRSSSAIC